MKTISKVVNKIRKRDDVIFIVVAVLFGIILWAAKIGNDDLVLMESRKSFTVVEALHNEIQSWYGWSSRLIVNFVASRLLAHAKWVWAAYMGISMYVLLKAISMLFVTHDKQFWNLYVACLLCAMPWTQLTTAGWIATTATYFAPLAFGIMGLVPLTKFYRNEKITIKESVFYSIALFYGTNEEQMMIVALGCYFIAFIYFVIKTKRKPYYIAFNLLLVIIELVNFIVCPGNNHRGAIESANWFPNYGMMDFVDKADIGLFSTLNCIILDNVYLFMLVILSLISYLVFKNTCQTGYRILGTYSFITLVLIGPLKEITAKFFPNMRYITDSVDSEGLVTVENVKDPLTWYKYTFLLSIVFGIVIAIALVSKELIQFWVSILILGLGLASRVAMGFSPTVYASRERTFEMLFLCIIMVGVYIVTGNIEIDTISLKKIKILKYVMLFAIIFSLWEIAGLVGGMTFVTS